MTTQSDYTPRGRVLTGRRVLIGFVAFFATIFIANGTMVYVALTTFSGVETDDAYRKGRSYNDVIAAGEAQRALGWRAEIEQEARAGAEGPEGLLRVTMTDRAGAPLDDLLIEANFRRPADSSADRSWFLRPLGKGVYEVPFALPAAGNWKVHLKAQSPKGTRFALEKRLMIKG